MKLSGCIILWWLTLCTGALLGAALYEKNEPGYVLPAAVLMSPTPLVMAWVKLRKEKKW